MATKFTYLFCSFLLIGITSCKGWTEKEKTQFLESCEAAKAEKVYCDCVLEKALREYQSFDDFKKDEAAFAELITSEDCLEKHRTASEKK